MLKESYAPRFITKRKILSPRQRLKNKMRYRKNKYKIQVYNRKYRLKNRMQLKRRTKLRRLKKRK